MMLALVALGSCQAFADPAPAPPELDCSLGFEGLRNWAAWLPGAQRTNGGGRDVITLAAPETWRVEIAVHEPGEPAQPAVILRKFREAGYGRLDRAKQGLRLWRPSAVCGADCRDEDRGHETDQCVPRRGRTAERERSPLASRPSSSWHRHRSVNAAHTLRIYAGRMLRLPKMRYVRSPSSLGSVGRSEQAVSAPTPNPSPQGGGELRRPRRRQVDLAT